MRTVVCLLCVIVAPGCAALQGKRSRSFVGRVDTLFVHSNDCGRPDPGLFARWIYEQETDTFRPAFAKAPENELPDAERKPEKRPDEGRFVWIDMGLQPTTGHRLVVADPTLHVAKGIGRLVLDFQSPAPGTTPEAHTTSPCLVVSLPAGELEQLDLVDTTGKLRAVLRRDQPYTIGVEMVGRQPDPD